MKIKTIEKSREISLQKVLQESFFPLMSFLQGSPKITQVCEEGPPA
jgi:hypothetical protein